MLTIAVTIWLAVVWDKSGLQLDTPQSGSESGRLQHTLTSLAILGRGLMHDVCQVRYADLVTI